LRESSKSPTADYNHVERFRVPARKESPKQSEPRGIFVDLSLSFMEHLTTQQCFVERGYTLLTSSRRVEPHAHRVYEVEHGDHLDRYRDPPTLLTKIEPIGLKFLAGFERLASWAERGRPAPRSQCIPVGGTIVDHPASIGRPTVCPDGGPLVQVEDDGNLQW
jgi:hypothetical protein